MNFRIDNHRTLYKLKQTLCLLGLLCSCHLVIAQVNSDTADSLVTELQSARVDTVKVDILIQLAKLYLSTDPEKTYEYAGKAEEISEKSKFNKGLANVYRYYGLADYFRSDYARAFDHWEKSATYFEKANDLSNVARIYSNMGAVYFNGSDNIRALEYYLKSDSVANIVKDTLRMMDALTNIGALYGENEVTYDKAISFYQKALALGEKLNEANTVGTIAGNLGEIYSAKSDLLIEKGNKTNDEKLLAELSHEIHHLDSLSLAYYHESWTATAGTENETFALRGIGKVYMKEKDYDQALLFQNRALALAENLEAKLDISQSQRAIGDVYAAMDQHELAIEHLLISEEIAQELESDQDLVDIYSSLTRSYDAIGDYSQAFKYQQLLTEKSFDIYKLEMGQRMDGMYFDSELEKKQAEMALVEEQRERQRLEKQAFQAGLGFIVIIAFILLRMYFTKVKTNRLLDKQKDQIESLLLNTLPADIVKELNANGVSKPKDYQTVSVLFTDFKGFSALASELTPHELIDELTKYFTAFDEIMEELGVEKIKTIGDAYMCAAGVPTPDPDNALKMVKAAIKIQEFMQEAKKERIAADLPPWELRVGIHTGPIVAGVVGIKKYAYDIWGDTVNVASRMESNGEAGRINISAATYELVKHKYVCEHRGKIEAKNIGEIDMYFIEREIHEEVEEKLMAEA